MTAEYSAQAGDRRIEYAPREQIRALQDRKLAELSAWVYSNAPYWRSKFDEKGVTPADIGGVADSHKLPFGIKEEYRSAQKENPPYGGLLCRSEEAIHRESGFVWETSGTTGRPLQFLCSRNGADYRADVDVTCRLLQMAGLGPGDKVAMLWPLTLWAVGHGIMDAAEELGITVLPLGPSYDTEYRVQKVAEYEPTAIMTTPSYALKLAEVGREEGLDTTALGTETVVVSGEPSTEETRERLGDLWGTAGNVFDYYGFSEAFNCRSIECEYHDGMHIFEDHYLAQVVDPDDGQPVEAGEEGELVITALSMRDISTGFRYRTGDLVRYTDEPCECGRTTRRIEVVGRMDDMRTIRGVNVYPQAVESIVMDVDDLANEFRLVHERDGGLDRVRVLVEPNPDVSETEEFREDLQRKLGDAFGNLTIPVEFADQGELERFDFKADRWVDQR